jgi:hypothetical protein
VNAYLALGFGAVFSVALFLNGLWILQRETMPDRYLRPRWLTRRLGRSFPEWQWRHAKMVARIHVLAAPVFLLIIVAVAVQKWRTGA